MKNFDQRRKLIKLMAVGSFSYVMPAGLVFGQQQKKPELHQWYGFAMGAEVSLQIYHDDGEEARRIIRKSIKIIRDMEGLFSLYKEDSVLSRLNRQGIVNNPPREFVDLLRTTYQISKITSGAFDITVQPLWQFYKSIFSDRNGDKYIQPNALKALHDLIGYEKIHISNNVISFERTGMAATLNGIAQGYVTDRVSDYLKSEGMTSVLVDIGEYRALGPQADQSPWRVALADPERPGQFSEILDIMDGAVATSSGLGDCFDRNGEYHHLFDPHSAKSSNRYLSVTVMAPVATLADGLSTAFYAMSLDDIKECLKETQFVKVRLTDRAGAVIMA